LTELSRGAELFASRWLEKRGYEILERNFRTRRAEIDLIAVRDHVLAFVEVKFAGDGSTTRPLEKIDQGKISRIVHASRAFLGQYDHHGEIRYDVAAVGGTGREYRMENYIEDAFRPDLF